jgi:phosphatidyl-myo-inositol dimannoside synthase
MAPRPRLLILTPDFPPAPGGIQVMAHRLATGMKGFETRVLALDSPGARSFDSDGSLAVRRVRASAAPRGPRNALLNVAALADALMFRPDVTLSMHIVASPAAATIRRWLGKPTVQYFHAEEIGTKPKLAAFAVARADEVVAVSMYTADLISATGAVPASLRLIPPGVDIPSDPTPQPADRPTFVTIARLEERYKGHDVMVRALALVRAKVPDAQWIVIGDGSLREGLEQQARSCGVADSVRFLGTISDKERDWWLRRADLLAMPSRLPAGGLAGEGFGIAYLEAGVFGKPVVAGNVGGALDSVSDGESGLLVDPLDPLAVAEAITSLLLDAELAGRLGSAGAERARAFAWPLIAERVETVLLELYARSTRFRASSGRTHENSARTPA